MGNSLKKNVNSCYGFIFSLIVIMITSIDGLFYVVNSSHNVGRFNIFISLVMLLGLLIILIVKGSYFKTVVANKKSIKVLVVSFILIVVYLISVLNNFQYLKLIRDSFYILIFPFFYIAIRTMGVNGLFLDSFVKYLILIAGFFLPLLTLSLGWYNDEGRFIGIYVASSFSGNISAIILGLLILYPSKIFRPSVKILICFFLIVIIFESGTRSALIIGLLALLVKVFEKKPILGFSLIAFIVFIFSILSALYYEQLTEYINVLNDSRMLSIKDMEGGSLGTRLSWILNLWFQISSDSYIGGFGPGSAELYLGYIPHFDFLKIFYDYSILGLICYVFLLSNILRSDYSLISYYHLFVVIMLSLHNMIFSPVLILFWLISTSAINEGYSKNSYVNK